MTRTLGGGQELHDVGYWPTTYQDEWCGEWQPAGPVSATRAETNPTDVAVLLSTAEVAKLMGISAKTFERMRAIGKIGPTVLRLSAQMLRYDAAEVNAWLVNRNHKGQLHESDTWPAVWAQLRRTSGRCGK